MKILITGASSGLGYNLGKKFAKRGHLVYLTTHTKEQLSNLKQKLKEEKVNALCFKMDITTDDIQLVDKINIDCLINHAGIGIGGSLLYMDIENLKKNYEVNVFASFNLLKRVYKNMKKNNINGKIFVTSSLASIIPIPFLGCYTSSKAAISMITETLKKELKYINSNISISLIEPGAYSTGFNQVMINNKEIYLEKNNEIYDNCEVINKKQNKLFKLIESKNYDSLTDKIVKQIEKKRPKFKIRAPFIQKIVAKMYLIFIK